jgi:acyl carrier protein
MTQNVQEDLLTHVRGFVTTSLGDASLPDDGDIFGTGLANSLFVVQIVVWVERTFDVTVGPGDLEISNFSSIAALTSFLDRKLAQHNRDTKGTV